MPPPDWLSKCRELPINDPQLIALLTTFAAKVKAGTCVQIGPQELVAILARGRLCLQDNDGDDVNWSSKVVRLQQGSLLKLLTKDGWDTSHHHLPLWGPYHLLWDSDASSKVCDDLHGAHAEIPTAESFLWQRNDQTGFERAVAYWPDV